MLNHLRNLRLGSTSALARALLLLGTFSFTRPAQPSPPPGKGEVGQIVELVDAQGRRIYINTERLDSGFRIHDSASRGNCPALGSGGTGLACLIQQAADRRQLDPDLIHAIVNVESGCDPRALSPKGAMGLMQLVPATARRFGVEDPFDPKQNIEGGTSYLKYLLALFDGDLGLSLAAYNAGENLVLRRGGIPPFPETRDYVRKVRSLYPFVSASQSSGNPKRAVKAGEGTAHAASPAGLPFYTYVDGQGVLHVEQ